MITDQLIYNRLVKSHGKNLRFEFDIRFLQKWIDLYPDVFPDFIKQNNYKTIFNHKKLRYEFIK